MEAVAAAPLCRHALTLSRVIAGLLAGLLWLPAALPAQETSRERRTLSEWKADLADPAPGTRRRAVVALAAFGPETLPLLSQALGDADPEVRLAAANGLGRLGPAAHPAAPSLARAMRDRVPFVRRGIATALGAITPATPEAVEALMAALVDPDAAVIDNAAHSLLALGPAAVPALCRALKDPDVGLRQMASITLSAGLHSGQFRPAGRQTVAVLIEALEDSDADVRDEAARSLAELGQQATEALPALRKMAAADPAEQLRRVARRAIESIEGH